MKAGRTIPSDQCLQALLATSMLVSCANAARADPIHYKTHNSEIDIYAGSPPRQVVTNVSPWSLDIPVMEIANIGTDCKNDAPAYFDLMEVPQHGIVCIRLQESKSDISISGAKSSCDGKPALYSFVYYEPFSGFKGVDSFVLWNGIEGRGLQAIETVTMNITAPDGNVSEPGDKRRQIQPKGRVGLCQNLTS